MSDEGEVTIAGRVFTLGAVYLSAPHVRPYEPGRLLPLRLVGYDPGYPWPGGRVEAELVPTAGARTGTGCPARRGRVGPGRGSGRDGSAEAEQQDGHRHADQHGRGHERECRVLEMQDHARFHDGAS
jgi:hypothetical protein